ncbi:MAG TPA: COX15/CtaA family protein [Streptosporangiaceae bacterium]|nr:COX15/CtaA family protein [Streptosporangiaceae bacterium]
MLTGSAPGSARPGAPPPSSRPSRPLSAAARGMARSLTAPSAVALRRWALAGVLASVAIIATGAAVRLSQSGLGCPDWPACTAHSIGATGATGQTLVHRWIEFGNRLVTAAILVVAVGVSVAAWRFRPDGTGRPRRDLLLLALAQPAGIVAEAVLGGIVVLTKLDPVWVSVHFLLSIALTGLAVMLHVRAAALAAPPAAAPPPAPVRRDLRVLSVVLAAVAAAMVAAGTVVTGTGPLAGAGGVARYNLPLAGVTQLHADIGWLLTGLTVALVAGMALTGAPPRAMRPGWLLIGLILAQGSVGYAQYFAGLPAGLVWVHVTGAVLIWVTVLRLMFALHDGGPAGA